MDHGQPAEPVLHFVQHHYLWVVWAGVAILVLPAFAALLGGFLMKQPNAGSRTHSAGCFLFSIGLWVLKTCVIGGTAIGFIGVALAVESSLNLFPDELKNQLGATRALGLAITAALLGLLGYQLLRWASRYQLCVQAIFQSRFRSSVASSIPQLDRDAPQVLAFRAVWNEQFGTPTGHLEGWGWKAIRRRIELIYY